MSDYISRDAAKQILSVFLVKDAAGADARAEEMDAILSGSS